MDTSWDEPARFELMDDRVPSSVEAPRCLPTGVVTFLLTDVEGSTRLWEGDADAMAAAIARHYALLDAAIALHGGVRPTEQGEGDSVVGAFYVPTDALAAAVDAQRAFAAEPWPPGGTLRIRIALHTGEARLRGEDNYVGPTVIRCARLRATAHGGQIVLTGATHDLVADRLPDAVALRDLGSHRLKDLGRAERVWQVCHPDLAEEFPPLRSLDAVSNNLPVEANTFVGRDAEVAELADAVEGSRLVTLTGAGGSGKTRLALHAAGNLAERHPDGVRWIELAGLSNPELVPAIVARSFGVIEQAGKAPLDALCEQLADSQVLLVLDNCEHLLGACATLTETLLRRCRRLRVLATSREPLGVPGEATWRCPSMAPRVAEALFVERAVAVRPQFRPTETEAAAIAEICARLDGLPLAIELAAARVRMMAPSAILAALRDRFRLLTGGGQTSLPRQRTLEASVAWSHGLLDSGERALLRRLSVFAGGFTLEAAEGVCSDEAVDAYAVLDLLSHLIDKSLVQADVDEACGAGSGRYRLLETIRFFARQHLVDAGEGDVFHSRHRDWFLALAERAEPEFATAEVHAWLDRLDAEFDNFRAAVGWCQTTGDDAALARLTNALLLFFIWRMHQQEGGRWFARALADDAEPSVLRARTLAGAAFVALYGDDFPTLFRRGPEALAMARDLDDPRALARALNINGMVAVLTQADQRAARDLLEESVAIGRATGDAWAVLDGLKMLTVSWISQDDYAGLAGVLTEFRALATELGNRFYLAWYGCMLGWAGAHRGSFAEAEAHLHATLSGAAPLGGGATVGYATAFLGEIESLTGRHAEAETRLRRHIEQATVTGNGQGLPWAVLALARQLVGVGRPAEAIALVEPLVAKLRPLGVPLLVSPGLSVLGLARLALSDVDAAHRDLTEARRLAEALDNPWMGGQACHGLALTVAAQRRTGESEELLHQALALRSRAGLLPGIAEALEGLAELGVGERPTEAVRLLGAADALRAGIGSVRWPADGGRHEATLGRARSALGAEPFEAAWAEGAALSVDDAVAYASRTRGERKRPPRGWASLTPTELAVVRLVTGGLSNPEIGERLFIGRATVKTHLAHIFQKLDLANRAELAVAATRHGIVEETP